MNLEGKLDSIKKRVLNYALAAILAVGGAYALHGCDEGGNNTPPLPVGHLQGLVRVNIINPTTGNLIGGSAWDGGGENLTYRFSIESEGATHKLVTISDTLDYFTLSEVVANENCIGNYNFNLRDLSPGFYSINFADPNEWDYVESYSTKERRDISQKVISTVGSTPIEVRDSQTTNVGLITLYLQ